jgi:hypothetical protein
MMRGHSFAAPGVRTYAIVVAMNFARNDRRPTRLCLTAAQHDVAKPDKSGRHPDPLGVLAKECGVATHVRRPRRAMAMQLAGYVEGARGGQQNEYETKCDRGHATLLRK